MPETDENIEEEKALKQLLKLAETLREEDRRQHSIELKVSARDKGVTFNIKAYGIDTEDATKNLTKLYNWCSENLPETYENGTKIKVRGTTEEVTRELSGTLLHQLNYHSLKEVAFSDHI
jgi:hypothetical protein